MYFTTPDLDLIGTFGWHEDKEYKNKQINAFLGISKPELETGRTCLYVCPECGDIGCGAITVKIETTAHTVIWRDFGYENNYSEPNLTDYEEIGPFTFDKNEYFKTLESLRLQD